MGQEAERRGYLELEEIRNFPCGDLLLIDQLWVKFSGGKFGFSVQKQIWLDVGGKLDFGEDYQSAKQAYEKMSDRNGWRKSAQYISYKDAIFSTSAPIAHLPLVCIGLGGWVCCGVGGGFGFSRIETCKL
ncbi:MAG: GUN4 domain-containing protein [Leptolyngbyaceae cyanobacterium RM1_1_2]|nr:GUN4 domain-containing protein [Leptolyngbyaceae cyanobacterium RM1_1_2]